MRHRKAGQPCESIGLQAGAGDEPSRLVEFLTFGAVELEPYIHVDPETGDEYEFRNFAGGYSPPEAILALIDEVRRLRNADQLPGPPSTVRRGVGVLLGWVRNHARRGGDRGRQP